MEIFQSEEKCYICNEKFSYYIKKVYDHCHITGWFRGAACNDCNLKMSENYQKGELNIFCHNFTNFDSHFYIKNVKIKF